MELLASSYEYNRLLSRPLFARYIGNPEILRCFRPSCAFSPRLVLSFLVIAA